MNLMAPKWRNLALLAAVFSATVSTGCSQTPKQSTPSGNAKVGVSINAETATNIVTVKLTVSTDTTLFPSTINPLAAPIVTSLTNNDPSAKLSWGGYVQGIPAGTNRIFQVDAYNASSTVIYTGKGTADITAGATASVYLLLQGPNDGGFVNGLPRIDTLTASSTLVTVGTTPPPDRVALYFHATDPDPAATLTYQWTDSCSATSFDAPSISTGVVSPLAATVLWTPPTTAGVCTLTLKVIDSAGGTVTTYLAIQTQLSQTGNAVVNAYPNSWPIVSLTAVETFVKDGTGKITSVQYDLVATSADPDGDAVKYAWSVVGTGCTSAASGFTSPQVPAVTVPVIPLAFGPGANPTNTVTFTTDDVVNGCVLRVDVTDFWPSGKRPVGFTVDDRGGDTVGLINGAAPKYFAVAPQISHITAPNAPGNPQDASSATFMVGTNQIVSLGVDVTDPTPTYNNAPGTPFSYSFTWGGFSYVAGTLNTVTSSPGTVSANFQSSTVFTPGSFVKIVVTNAQGLTAAYTWNFKPANPCDGTAATVGATCDTGLGLCAPAGQCTAAGTCVDPAAVVCAAGGQCAPIGFCQASSGTCTYPQLTDGTSCNADSSGCTVNDACSAGACVAGAAPACNTPIDAQCQSAPGTCASTGVNSFVCNYASVLDGTTCNADSNGCTQNDACLAGACTAGPAVVCNTPAVCHTNPGSCLSGGPTSFSCVYALATPGTACNTAGPCITGQTCNVAGSCAGGTPFCATGLICDPAVPSCRPSLVAEHVARGLPVSGPAGLAIDVAGNSYVGGAIYSLTPVSFDGHSVTSTGDADIFLAKYTNGVAQWAVGIGDAGANPQSASGTAITNDGTLAVIGQFAGAVTIGSGNLNSAAPIDFLAGFDGSNGAGKWAKQLNDGSGFVKAVAANANDATPAHGNRIALCGFASGVTAPADLVTGATVPVGNDILVGAFSSAGTKLWASQIATAANEECDAVTVDDSGDVIASGSFSGASLTFPGLPALTGPGNSTRKYLWVAKFNGATGAPIAAVAFSGTAGQASPNSLTTDAAGDVVVGGSFTGNLTIGATLLTSAGANDAYVAKLTPALGTAWAVRLGGTGGDVAYGVATTSVGDVVVTGLFNRTTTGAAILTTTTTTASNPFVLKLDGLTGATQQAKGYGDAATSSGDALVVNRFGTDQVSIVGSFGATLTAVPPTSPPLLGPALPPLPVTAVNATDVFLVNALLE
jgi:hypothetical protein